MAGYGTYAPIADLKGVLGITTTTDDTVMRKMLESASRSIDRYTNRFFYTLSETKYFDGAKTLWVPDLLSITTIKTDEDGDGTYENILQAATEPVDYLLYGPGLEDAYNAYPKTRIEIAENSDYGSFANGIKRGVEIAGVWGYGDGISATPYVIDTGISEALTSGESDIDVSSVTNLSAGNLILIDSEQYYIYSISSSTLTTETKVNGTSNAAHDSGTRIYIYRYPADIRQACIDLASAFYQNRGKQGMSSERIGDYSYTMNKEILYSIMDDTIRSYRRMRV